MKNIINTIAGKLMAVCLLAVLISSCKKEQINNKDLFAYVPAGTTAFNELSETVTIISGKVVSKMETGIPALLTRSTHADVVVSAKIDTTLIVSYNRTNGTRYPSFPDGLFSLAKNGKVTVLKEQTQSVDSIKIQIGDASKLNVGDNNYLIPVVFDMANAGVSVSNTRQVMFVKLNLIVASVSIVNNSGESYTQVRLNRSGNITTGVESIDLKGILNIAVDRDVSLSITDNSSLVADFNKKNNKNYRLFPAGSYSLVTNNVVIQARQTTSPVNLQVKLNDYDLFLTGEEYLLPVQIKENISEGYLPVDPKRNVVYIHLSIFMNNVDPLNSFPVGLIADRTGWTAVASTTYTSKKIDRILDDDNETGWESDGKLPETVTVDTKDRRLVKGISIVPNYESIASDFLNMDIMTSNDGISWRMEGKYVGTATSDSSDYDTPDNKYVTFITPITARYFRLVINKTTDGEFAGMAEFNIIQ